LQEHLEGTRHPLELAGRLPDWAQRHLEGCSACREACWELVNVECSLRRMSEVPAVPVDLTASVLQALAREEPLAAPARDRRWMQAAAVLLVSLAVYGLTWVNVPVALQGLWTLVPTVTLPAVTVPGVSETMMALVAGIALLSGTALNWRWSRV
jgi:hypothetical protein